jgi:hypothetical protein
LGFLVAHIHLTSHTGVVTIEYSLIACSANIIAKRRIYFAEVKWTTNIKNKKDLVKYENVYSPILSMF